MLHLLQSILILRSSTTIRRRATLGDAAGNKRFHGGPAIAKNRTSVAKHKFPQIYAA
jgi:hypothetical protein